MVPSYRVGRGNVDRVPGFRRAGAWGNIIATIAGAGGQRGNFPARGPRAVGKLNPGKAGYPLGDFRGAARFAGSSEDAIGTTVSATAIRSVASPAFARRMVVIIMIAMLGCGLLLGLTHAVPWVSATNSDPSAQAPVDDNLSVETQASAPRDSRAGDMMPMAAPAGMVAPAPSAEVVQASSTASAGVPAAPEAPAQDQSSGVTLNPSVSEATPEATAAVPAAERQVPVAHEKPASTKTSAPKVATKKPAGKRAISQDPTIAEAPAQFPAIDITTPR
jgi:hypothetical protein